MNERPAKYGMVPVKGLFIVKNIKTGKAICEPVKEGLAIDIQRVANSGKVSITDKAKSIKQLLAEEK